MRTVSEDDYLTVRAANPRTGVVTPSVHSDSTTSLIDTTPAPKWRRVGDEWVSMEISQPTPDPSPPNSSYGPQSRAQLYHDRSPCDPPKLSSRKAMDAANVRNQYSMPLPSDKDIFSRIASGNRYPQWKISRPRNSNLFSCVGNMDRSGIPSEPHSTPTTTKIRRKRISSHLSDLQKEHASSDGRHEMKGSDMVAMPAAPSSNVNQPRSMSAPNDVSCKYFSPDDVGKDLPRSSIPTHLSRTKPGQGYPRSGSFLGVTPGDFIEDMPARFQSHQATPRIESILPAQPMNDGRFRLPASIAHKQNTSSQRPLPPHPVRSSCDGSQHHQMLPGMHWPKRGSIGDLRSPILKLQSPPTILHTGMIQGQGDLAGRLRSNPIISVELPRHHRIGQDEHLRRVVDPEYPSSRMNQDKGTGSASGNRNNKGHLRPSQYNHQRSTMNTSTSIITSPEIQTENTTQTTSVPPHLPLLVKKQRHSMPSLRRQDGSNSIPQMGLQQDVLEEEGIHNTRMAVASMKRSMSASKHQNHIPMPRTAMIDGIDFGNGLMTENPSPVTSSSNRKRRQCGSQLLPNVKRPGTAGQIHTYENRAMRSPRASSDTVIRKISHDGEHDGPVSSGAPLLQSPNTVPGHEDCCPLCCLEDCHSSCLGHASDSSIIASPASNLRKRLKGRSEISEREVGTNDLESISYVATLRGPRNLSTNPLSLRRSFRRQSRESHYDSFVDTRAEEIPDAEIASSRYEGDDEAVSVNFDAHYIHNLRSQSSSFSLRTLRTPSLSSTTQALLVPLNVLLMWCKHHPEILHMTALSLEKVAAMALHVLEVLGVVYQGLAEYGRSGKIKVWYPRSEGGWGLVLREGAVVIFEAIVVVVVTLMVVRFVDLVVSVGRVGWAIGKGALWALGIYLGFRAGTW